MAGEERVRRGGGSGDGDDLKDQLVLRLFDDLKESRLESTRIAAEILAASQITATVQKITNDITRLDGELKRLQDRIATADERMKRSEASAEGEIASLSAELQKARIGIDGSIRELSAAIAAAKEALEARVLATHEKIAADQKAAHEKWESRIDQSEASAALLRGGAAEVQRTKQWLVKAVIHAIGAGLGGLVGWLVAHMAGS